MPSVPKPFYAFLRGLNMNKLLSNVFLSRMDPLLSLEGMDVSFVIFPPSSYLDNAMSSILAPYISSSIPTADNSQVDIPQNHLYSLTG